MEKNGVKYDLSEGVTVEELDEEVIGEFERAQRGFRRGFVRFQPYGQVLPRTYAKYERILKQFPIKQDDIWISSFPKCGEWLQGCYNVHTVLLCRNTFSHCCYRRHDLDGGNGLVHHERLEV